MSKNLITQVKQTAIGGMQRATEVVGATDALSLVDLHKEDQIGDGAGSLIGGAAGVFYGLKKKHPVLGGIVGFSVGRNVPALLDSSKRREALVNLGETGVAVACSKATKKHPIVGFVVGRLVAGLVVHFGGLRG